MGKVCLRTGREQESAAYLQKGDGAETESGPKLDLPVHECYQEKGQAPSRAIARRYGHGRDRQKERLEENKNRARYASRRLPTLLSASWRHEALKRVGSRRLA